MECLPSPLISPPADDGNVLFRFQDPNGPLGPNKAPAPQHQQPAAKGIRRKSSSSSSTKP